MLTKQVKSFNLRHLEGMVFTLQTVNDFLFDYPHWEYVSKVTALAENLEDVDARDCKVGDTIAIPYHRCYGDKGLDFHIGEVVKKSKTLITLKEFDGEEKLLKIRRNSFNAIRIVDMNVDAPLVTLQFDSQETLNEIEKRFN